MLGLEPEACGSRESRRQRLALGGHPAHLSVDLAGDARSGELFLGL